MDGTLISKGLLCPRGTGSSGHRLDQGRNARNNASLRPNGRMPLSAHKEAGRLLKEVYSATYWRKGVYNRVNIARSILDDWLMLEYPDHEELPMHVYNQIYFHVPPRSFDRRISPEERARHIASLRKVQDLVAVHYPDSAPLQALLKKLDGAIEALESWI